MKKIILYSAVLCASTSLFAREIEKFEAREIKPVKARILTPPKKSDEKVSLNYFFRVWHTSVGSGAWSVVNEITGYETFKIAPGVKAGDLTIDPSGRYAWNSYGGKVGKWIKGDDDYQIILIDTVENKKWKVGFDPQHTGGRDIMIWDGYVWYDGRK